MARQRTESISTSLNESVKRELQADNTVSEEVPDDASALAAETRANIFTKIRFTWRPEDQLILDRIKIAAESEFEELFADTITVIDGFYASLRVPEQNENGIIKRGSDGRPLWKHGEDGKPIEDWSQINGQDVEQTLMNLERLKLSIVPEVNRLLNEAIYAKHVAQDIHDDEWGKVIQGTQGDRSARANRESRQDRYHAYLRYVLWSTCDVFLQEVSAFMLRLGKIRDWQIWNRHA